MKLLVVVIIVAVAGFFGYRFLTKPKPASPPAVEAEAEPEIAMPMTETKVTPRSNRVATTATTATSMPPTEAIAAPTPEWKQKLDGILASADGPEQKLQQLRGLLSKLPESEAEKAVQALTVSVKNEAFGFIKPLVVDPNLPEPVRDEFMVDLLNRPNSIKMPLVLEIARNPDHPDHENAYDTLEAFTGQKLGADWTAWEKTLNTWLKDNPDQVRKPKAEPEAN